MKFYKILLLVIFLAVNLQLTAQVSVSGVFDSTVSLGAGAGDAPAFNYGIEEYANIRMLARIRDRARFEGAINFLAAAGNYAAAAGQMANLTILSTPFGISYSSYISGQNYIAGIELERLFFRLNFEKADFEGGLLRIPFGFSQIWGSSDFLNPKNPIKPDARPRGILGGGLYFYPSDSLKLTVFGAAPRDPFSEAGGGGFAGLSLDKHWDKASIQGLYSFESPAENSRYGIHRGGLSVKADLEVSLVMDALYTYNHEAKTKEDGLSLSAGLDYSFKVGEHGKLGYMIFLTEYLYSGKSSSTAFDIEKNILGGSNEHYLYTGLTWFFNDSTNAGIALISCFDDISFTPIIKVNYDLFQGATLILMAQVPLDRDLFSGSGKRGELGPLPPGSQVGNYFNFSAKLRLKF